MQILGLLGMYFDAVVVEVEKYLLCKMVDNTKFQVYIKFDVDQFIGE